jgi:DegV family protein with EDD domain
MPSTCIVTDSTVQFSKNTFSGRNLVFQVPLRITLNDQPLDEATNILNFPQNISQNIKLKVTPPTPQECGMLFNELSQDYNEIIAISSSSALTGVFTSLEKASGIYKGKTSVIVIDSRSVGIGLGILVQAAAAGVIRGQSSAAIEESIRKMIPGLFTQISSSNLSYLENAGFISKPHGLLGDALSIIAVFSLEDGQLVPVSKVKNLHLLMDNYLEFIDEFTELDQVSIIQRKSTSLDSHSLRDHIINGYHGALFTDIPPNLAHAALFGPSAVSIFLLEKT